MHGVNSSYWMGFLYNSMYMYGRDVNVYIFLYFGWMRRSNIVSCDQVQTVVFRWI